MNQSAGLDRRAAGRTDLWLLVRQLAEALAATPEVERFRATEEALLADPEALGLLRRYEALKQAVASAPPAERSALVEALRGVEEAYRSHPRIAAHREARADLDRLMGHVSDVLNFALTGRPRPAGGDGCPGGCGRLGSP